MQAQGGALPETPLDPDQSLELLAEVALAYQQHGDHPRYFARVPGPCSFAVVLGECMGTGFNTISASWGGGSGPATIELVVIEWLRQMIGMPEGTEGVLLSAFNSWRNGGCKKGEEFPFHTVHLRRPGYQQSLVSAPVAPLIPVLVSVNVAQSPSAA